MKAGIAIDTWKLPIFQRHLTQAGYAYTKPVPFTRDSKTLILTVESDNALALEEVLRAANTEAARTGKPA